MAYFLDSHSLRVNVRTTREEERERETEVRASLLLLLFLTLKKTLPFTLSLLPTSCLLVCLLKSLRVASSFRFHQLFGDKGIGQRHPRRKESRVLQQTSNFLSFSSPSSFSSSGDSKTTRTSSHCVLYSLHDLKWISSCLIHQEKGGFHLLFLLFVMNRLIAILVLSFVGIAIIAIVGTSMLPPSLTVSFHLFFFFFFFWPRWLLDSLSHPSLGLFH